jgi:hypothetical protein
MTEHKPDCPWFQDYHACSCGVFDAPRFGVNPCKEIEVGIHTMPRKCLLVIPNTFIMCGEMGQYCSHECMRKANEKDTMR